MTLDQDGRENGRKQRPRGKLLGSRPGAGRGSATEEGRVPSADRLPPGDSSVTRPRLCLGEIRCQTQVI